MADPAPAQDAEPRKKSRLPLVLGVALALAGAAGGFFAVQSGMIMPSDSAGHDVDETEAALPDVAFVPVEPLVVSLGTSEAYRHLRFSAQLEVPSASETDVVALMPRVVDVLNSYLRALDTADLEDRTGLARLRAQMLRRIQVIAGPERVNDLLIMEFILN